ncbi:MAG: hypothetical protein ACI3U8_01995 [Candidatus Onthomonas sp.]
MNSVKYESPKFDFQELRLVERVAGKCWGYAYAWYDVDGDRQIDEREKVKLEDIGLNPNGCQGDGARTELADYFYREFGVKLSKQDVSTNTMSKSIIPSNS